MLKAVRNNNDIILLMFKIIIAIRIKINTEESTQTKHVTIVFAE